MAMIQAIETSWRGYRFRSRLEARWAVFFERCGVQWEYESEGFDLGEGNGYYLPDFRLRQSGLSFVDCKSFEDETGEIWAGGDVWVEVKPPIESNEADLEKFAAFVMGAPLGQMFLLVKGDPLEAFPAALAFSAGTGKLNEASVLPYLGDGWMGFLGENQKGTWNARERDCWNRLSGNSGLLGAMRAARSARFEHGETPT